MENWENKLNHVDLPNASVQSHKEALRNKLQTTKPRSRMRASVVIASLVFVLVLTGLTVANPGWIKEIYVKVTAKELHFTSEDGRQVQIKTVEVEAPEGVVTEDMLKGDPTVQMSWTLDPADPRTKEILESGGGLQKMMHVEGEVTGELKEGQHEMKLIIERDGDTETYIMNGDTLKSPDVIKSLEMHNGVIQKTFTSLEGEPTIETTNVDGAPSGLAATFELGQNYPNPFNPTTQIPFELKEAAEVTLKVFDMTGREVATLVNGYQSAGSHSVAFDGSSLASGTYLYTLKSGDFQFSRTMVLVK